MPESNNAPNSSSRSIHEESEDRDQGKLNIEKKSGDKADKARERIRTFLSETNNGHESEIRSKNINNAIDDASKEFDMPTIDICRIIWEKEAKTLDAAGENLIQSLANQPNIPAPLYNEYLQNFFANDAQRKIFLNTNLILNFLSGEMQNECIEAALEGIIHEDGIANFTKNMDSSTWESFASHLQNRPFIIAIYNQLIQGSPEVILSSGIPSITQKMKAEAFISLQEKDVDSAIQYIKFVNNDESVQKILPDMIRSIQITKPFVAYETARKFCTDLIDETAITVAQEASDDLFKLLSDFSVIEKRDCSEFILKTAFQYDPTRTLLLYSQFKNHPYAGHIIDEMIQVNPYLLLKEDILESISSTQKEKSKNLINQINKLHTKVGMQQRLDLINEIIIESNPSVSDALKAFNKKFACSLNCLGVHQTFINPSKTNERIGPIECVFINTWENESDLPIRIGIPLYKLSNAASSKEILRLLEDSFTQQLSDTTSQAKGNLPLKEQYELWKNPDQFDLPIGKTVVATGGVPEHLNGVEKSIADITKSVFVDRYQSTVKGVSMENPEVWEDFAKNMGLSNIQKPDIASSKNVLSNMRNGLQWAIENNQEQFVQLYFFHGSPDGEVRLTDGDLKTEKMAESISVPFINPKNPDDPRNGEPLCALMDILIIADSCHSGSQIKSILGYLKKNKIPVKNLRIVTSSNEEEANGGVRFPSVINETLWEEKNNDSFMGSTPAFSYYLSCYFQIIKHQQDSGKKLAPSAGTFAHALRFADLMARKDASIKQKIGPTINWTEQDMQYFHYSTFESIDMPLSMNEVSNNEKRAA